MNVTTQDEQVAVFHNAFDHLEPRARLVDYRRESSDRTDLVKDQPRSTNPE